MNKDDFHEEDLHFYKLIVEEGGEIGELIKKIEWKNMPLGSFQYWPIEFKYAFSLSIQSGSAISIWWGERFLHYYNNSYIPIIRTRHPGFAILL
jgi:hypothetical protein